MTEGTVLPKRRTDGKEKLYREEKRINVLMKVLLVLVVLTVLFFLWFLPVRISGDSMAPTLEEGDTVLIDRLARFWKKPVRGDMVAFTTDDGVFIKRIVGLPGETVEVAGGRVFIDSVPLEESMYASVLYGDAEAVDVPAGSVYVLGDNRSKVYDSRLSKVGCISYEAMTGVLRLRVAPLGRFTVFF